MTLSLRLAQTDWILGWPLPQDESRDGDMMPQAIFSQMGAKTD